MTQSRLCSLIEAFGNILIGFAINMGANFAVFPLFGWHITTQQNIALGIIYTGISLARSYTLRRWFNRYNHQVAAWLDRTIKRAN